MAQLRAMGLPEHLPHGQVMVYRFLDSNEVLLYVGITVAPCGRWQSHKKRSAWWSLAATVLIEWHGHERDALRFEVQAIREELPLFNKRSAVPEFMSNHCTPHTLLSRNVPLSLSRSRSRSLRGRSRASMHLPHIGGSRLSPTAAKRAPRADACAVTS